MNNLSRVGTKQGDSSLDFQASLILHQLIASRIKSGNFGETIESLSSDLRIFKLYTRFHSVSLSEKDLKISADLLKRSYDGISSICNCLSVSLTMHILARSSGTACVVRIGSGIVDGKLISHAWVHFSQTDTVVDPFKLYHLCTQSSDYAIF